MTSFRLPFHETLVHFLRLPLCETGFLPLFVKVPLFKPIQLLVFTVNTVSSDSPYCGEPAASQKEKSLQGHFLMFVL